MELLFDLLPILSNYYIFFYVSTNWILLFWLYLIRCVDFLLFFHAKVMICRFAILSKFFDHLFWQSFYKLLIFDA